MRTRAAVGVASLCQSYVWGRGLKSLGTHYLFNTEYFPFPRYLLSSRNGFALDLKDSHPLIFHYSYRFGFKYFVV